MKKKLFSTVGLLFLALTLILVGCGDMNNATEPPADSQNGALASTGMLILKVNPEIAIAYNDTGEVTEVKGLNSEGEAIVEGYSDYIGKDSGVVLEELIAMIGEAGYFVEEIEGESKHIVLELEPGSVLPTDNFLQRVATNAQRAVQEYKLNSDVTVDDQTLISLDEAKRIAFEHAGVDGSQAQFDDEELDSDDGVLKYELEFNVGRNEYEYDIEAFTGEILKYEQDIKDDAGRQTSDDGRTSSPRQETKQLTEEEALNIALDHVGLTRSQVNIEDLELDTDDGRLKWEINFKSNNREYEFDIDARTGEIFDFKEEVED